MAEPGPERGLARADEPRFPLAWLEDAPSTPPLSAWSRLRTVMDGLVGVLRGAVAATTQRRGGAHPDWERRRRELEARELRVETARREIEKKQEGLEPEWSRVFAELDRLRDGWDALGRDHPPVLGPEELNLPDLAQRTLFIELLWDRLMLRDAADQREQAMVARAWERLAAGLASAVEEGRTAGLIDGDWRALMRRLRDLERRWSLHCKSKRMLLAEQDVLLAHQRMHDAETRLRSLLEQVRRGLPDDAAQARTAEELAALHRALEEQRREAAAAIGQAGAWKEEAERLAHQVAGLRGESEAAKSGSSALAARIKSLEGETSALRLEGASVAETGEALRREASEWRLRAETVGAEVLGLRAEARRRTEAAAGLEAEAARWKSQAETLQTRLDEELKRFQSLDGMARDRAERAAEAAGLRRAAAEAASELDRRGTRLAEVSAELAAARQDRERAAGEAAEARLAASEAERRAREALGSWKRGSEQESAALKGRIVWLEDQLRAAHQESLRMKTEAETAAGAAREERDRLREQAQAAARAGAELSARLAAAAAERDASLQLTESLGARVETLETETDRLARAGEAAAREARALSDELAASGAERDAHRRLASERLAGLEAREKEAARLREEAGALRTALSRAEEEHDALRRTLRERDAAVPAAPETRPAPPQDSAPLPPLQAVLEPGWEKVLAALDRTLASAGARLRRLATGAASEAARLAARQAAGDVAQARDVVTLVTEYFGDGMEETPSGSVQQALEEALSAWEPALRSRGISLVRRLDAKLAAPCPRPEALRVAFYQVVRNACEAMPSGGCLTVTAGFDRAAVKVSFSDTGPGFAKDALGSAFAPFATAKPAHLGLGLALARRTARRMGGEVDIASNPSGGAAVSFHLPSDQNEPPP